MSSTGCCKRKPPRIITVNQPAAACLDGVPLPVEFHVQRIPCEGAATSCYDFENAKNLIRQIATYIDYRDAVESRCPRTPEGESDATP